MTGPAAATVPAAHAAVATVPAAHAIDAAWCDLRGVFLRGWAHCHGHPVLAGTLRSSGRQAELVFTPRPDVLAAYPEVAAGQACGFSAYLECPAFRPLTLQLITEAGVAELDVTAGPELGARGAVPSRPAPLDRFTACMKAVRGTVLEIGARVVGTYSSLHAERFLPECRFIGTDVHAAPGVDLVVDAHRLGEAVPPGSLDGVFSLAVLEHLAAPWVVAAEINRALRPGGLTLHLTHQTYPLHEQPNDFWRMSDDALRLLFGPATGFEVLDASLAQPVQIMPAVNQRHGAFLDLPLHHAYASAFVLARKVAELPADAVRWPLPELAVSRSYPAHAPGPAAAPRRAGGRRRKQTV